MKITTKIWIALLLFTLAWPSVVAELAEVGTVDTQSQVEQDAIGVDLYTPINNNPLNIEEQMKLSPMFTPDNALDIHAAWIARANTTIELQNQYITQFDDNLSWDIDPNPIVRELVKAATERNVQVRVQVRELADSDDVTSYLNGITNIEVRWMGSSTSTPDASYLSATHNKLVILDSKVTLISSINFGENAFLNNREAGMVVQSPTVSQYFLTFFEEDWADGEIPPVASIKLDSTGTSIIEPDYASHTNIPKTNFSGIYNVSAYVNPDNADKHIFKYLESAKESIYVSMYTISRQDFVDTLVQLKQNNPALDIQVLISNRRVGGDENIDTQASALQLVENLIPVYNSTDGLNYYHNKYWIIDQKHTFIYSGNWSPRSVTPEELDNEYTSSDPNRDMGIAVHNAPDIANFVKTEVWDKDIDVADAYELPVGIKQNSFEESDVVSGTVDITGTVSGLNGTASYKFGSGSFTNVTLQNNSFSVPFDTTGIPNGITELTVKVISNTSAVYQDSVTVNVANYPSSENWRVLITEVMPNPSDLSDTEGEFIELSNTFDFDVLISGWSIGDDSSLYTFPDGYTMEAQTSIVLVRDKAAFDNHYSLSAEVEFSFSLSNGGDAVKFVDHHDVAIDGIAWGSGVAADGSTSVAEPDAGLSLQRVDPTVDTNSASDWVAALETPHSVSVGSTTSSSSSSTTTTSDIIDTDLSDLTSDLVPLYVPLFSLSVVMVGMWYRRRRL